MSLKEHIVCGKEQNYCFFIPVSKLVHNSLLKKEFEKNGNKLTIDTSYGRVQIRNRLLTESHQRLLNEIIGTGTISSLQNGGVEIRFDEKNILSQLKMGETNLSHLRSQVQEITDASFYIGVKRTRLVKIILKHSLGGSLNATASGFQRIELSPEYVEAKKIEFIIANSTLNKKLREIEISTIPTIIRAVYVASEGKANIEINLDEILERIYFTKTKDTIKVLNKNLSEFAKQFKDDFFINYNKEDKTFTTTLEIEQYLTENKKPISQEEINKLNSFLGLEFESKENEKHTIKKINFISFREYEIITEDEQVFFFNEYFDDFVFFLDELLEKNGKKKIVRQTLF